MIIDAGVVFAGFPPVFLRSRGKIAVSAEIVGVYPDFSLKCGNETIFTKFPARRT